MMKYLTLWCAFAATAAFADEPYQAPEKLSGESSDPSLHLQAAYAQQSATKIAADIYYAQGFGNTFLITTDDGNVIIDTSLAAQAPLHKKLLTAVSDAPIHSIIVTHGHGDHTGGIELWRGEATRVIAHRESAEFLAYQERLAGFFNRRNRAQFGFAISADDEPVQSVANYPRHAQTRLIDAAYDFSLGDTEFSVRHMPGETYDALVVWLPAQKAVFVGDLFYLSFPNIYTLRGTKPRWALDYVDSIDKVLALKPKILIPSHGEPIHGFDNIEAALTRYRAAIRHVHDATVAGMNAGKDVFTLMREITLPENLDIGEGYGRIAWSVRGIYEGYAGWHDGNPTSMYGVSPAAADKALVEIAGGPAEVVQRARVELAAGSPVMALRLCDAAIAADPSYAPALRTRLEALQRLREASTNYNEAGWLNFGIQQTRRALGD